MPQYMNQDTNESQALQGHIQASCDAIQVPAGTVPAHYKVVLQSDQNKYDRMAAKN